MNQEENFSDAEKQDVMDYYLSLVKEKVLNYMGTTSSLKNKSQITIVNTLMKNTGYRLAYFDSKYYAYDSKYWKEINEEKMKLFLKESAVKLTGNINASLHSFVDGLLKQFKLTALVSIEKVSGHANAVNLSDSAIHFKNGFVESKPHKKEDYLKYLLPYGYNPNAETPIFNSFINKVLPDISLQNVLFEFLGSVFIANDELKMEKSLILVGKGSNGKSVLYEIVKALFGKINVGSFSLENLTDTKGYYRSNLNKILLNYASEINQNFEPATFKQLSSGEPIEYRPIYDKPGIMEDYCKFVFNTNFLPNTKDSTESFFRRLLIIPFDVTITSEERDPNLHTKIIKDELPGVLNYVIQGYKRLFRNKDFSPSIKINQTLEDYRKKGDNVKYFIAENCYLKSQTETILKKDIFKDYKFFCGKNDLIALPEPTFGRRIEELGFAKVILSGNVTAYYMRLDFD